MGLVVSRVEGQAGLVVLNQPETRNALTMELRADLLQAVEAHRQDARVRAIVLGAEGKAFCAGGDLKSLVAETPASMLERQFNVQNLMRAIMTGDKPVIAAVEGAALGAGLSLALSCDIVVATTAARFGCVFGKVGLAPDLGLTWVLPRRVGSGRARLLMLTGRVIDGATACAWGMADELAEPGTALATACAIAEEIAGTGPLAAKVTRRALRQDFGSLDQALDFEAVAQTMLKSTEDFAEAARSFSEKRQPVFRGR